jgi:secreted trypsin-like serine protease
MFPSYDVEVVRIHVHEDFYAGNLQNDIALLQLKVPLDYSVMQHIGNICLPPVNGPVTYSNCIVTGWGQQVATSEVMKLSFDYFFKHVILSYGPISQAKGDTNTFSRLLRSVSQQLVTSDKCTKALRPFLGTFYQFPDKGFVCAYDSDGKDSCFGDGGGALACRVGANGYRKKDQYHVVGLVSWGVGCGLPNVPSAYTAVFDYNDWIRSKIASFDPYPDNSLPSGNNVVMVRSNPSSETSETTDYIDLAFPGTTK